MRAKNKNKPEFKSNELDDFDSAIEAAIDIDLTVVFDFETRAADDVDLVKAGFWRESESGDGAASASDHRRGTTGRRDGVEGVDRVTVGEGGWAVAGNGAPI